MPPLTSTRKRVVALSLIMLCLPSAARTLAAPAPQDARRAERERLGRLMEPSADVEEFRRELSAYFDELEGVLRLADSVPAVRRKFAEAGFKPLTSLAESRGRLAHLSHNDLTQLRAAYAASPGWREAPSALGSLFRPALRERVTRPKTGGDPTDSAITEDNCANGLAAGITNTDISIAEAAVIAAEGVMEAIPSDTISLAARLVTITAFSAVKGTSLALQTLKAIADDCSGAAFEASIQQQLTDARNALTATDNANAAAVVANDDANMGTIVANSDANRATVVANDNTNRAAIIADAAANRAAVFTKIGDTSTAIIANDNANKTAIVANDNANKNAVVANANANTTYLVRVAIEADLSAADNAVPVALFETPETMCAGAAPFNQCGLLGMTRAVVVQTIARLAGSAAAQANSFLAKGDGYKAAGNYRAAYQQYRLAYKAAAK